MDNHSHELVEFNNLRNRFPGILRDVDGWLTDREIEFLAAAAAFPTADGEILELGAFHGKSTIVLALAARLSEGATVTSVDPLEAAELHTNLQAAGVAADVNAIDAFSFDMYGSWDKPLRLLWNDGANDIATVRDDIQAFLPHLADRGIIAFHDVLNRSGDRIHNFIDDILSSDHFGACGICGTIGWAQYHADPSTTASLKANRLALKDLLTPLRAYHTWPRDYGRMTKIAYKIKRSRVTHGRVHVANWIDRVGANASVATGLLT